ISIAPDSHRTWLAWCVSIECQADRGVPVITTSPAVSGRPISIIFSASQAGTINRLPRHSTPDPDDARDPLRLFCSYVRKEKPEGPRSGGMPYRIDVPIG